MRSQLRNLYDAQGRESPPLGATALPAPGSQLFFFFLPLFFSHVQNPQVGVSLIGPPLKLVVLLLFPMKKEQQTKDTHTHTPISATREVEALAGHGGPDLPAEPRGGSSTPAARRGRGELRQRAHRFGVWPRASPFCGWLWFKAIFLDGSPWWLGNI